MTSDGPADDEPGAGHEGAPDDEASSSREGPEIAIGPTIAVAVLALALAALIVLIFCDAFGVV